MNILVMLTSHDQLGQTGYKTGLWLGGFTEAYYVLKDAGHELTLASPRGVDAPIDPRSDDPSQQTGSVQRFKQDKEARTLLADTVRLDQVDAADFDAALVVGGHGPMWDLAADVRCAALLSTLHAAGRPIALVCHGPAALRRAVDRHGLPLVLGRHVTCFSNSEEQAMGMAHVVPFLLQDELIRLGGRYSKAGDGEAHVVRDGWLITGQNEASAAGAAQALLEALRD
jgi:putative intracellular protease/amidase